MDEFINFNKLNFLKNGLIFSGKIKKW
jgi:hypothetical protein